MYDSASTGPTGGAVAVTGTMGILSLIGNNVLVVVSVFLLLIVIALFVIMSFKNTRSN